MRKVYYTLIGSAVLVASLCSHAVEAQITNPFPTILQAIPALASENSLLSTTRKAPPNTVPVAKCKNLTLDLIEGCMLSLDASAFDAGSYDDDGDALEFSVSPEGPYPVGTTLVTFRVDDGDLSNQCSAKITVRDKTPPTVLVREQVIQLVLSAQGVATITVEDVDAGSTDNCAIASRVLDKTTFTCADIGENWVLFTVTDPYGNSAAKEVTVEVVDQEAPAIAEEWSFQIDENLAQGTVVGQLEAENNCGELSYFIKSGNTNGAFTIDYLGRLKVQNSASLDYETTPVFTLTVEVADNSDNVALSQVLVQLNNLNDHKPQVHTVIATQEVLEDAVYSLRIPADAFTDADADDALTLTASGLPAWLQFDAGTSTFGGTPHNEHVGTTQIMLRATDLAGLFAEQRFTITVINTNDAPQAIRLTSAMLEENKPAGTLIGTFSTEDVDADDLHTYSLTPGVGDADNAAFKLDGNTLTTARILNFEEKERYTLRIRSTDLTGASLEEIITITLTDVEDATAFLPNLFTPNGDGSNDYFILRALQVEQLSFRIYNKQGRVVYQTSNAAEATEKGWDGTLGGSPQPDGTYVWKLEGRYKDGKPLSIQGKTLGNIILIR